MKDQKIELPDVPFIFQYGQYNEDDLRQPDCRLIPYRDFQEVMQAYARTAIEPYVKRISELEAARIAYASEFVPDEDGNPDVGSIHENIRKLKADSKRIAELESANAELERLCDETYVAQGADAYNLACEEMEDWQAERRKAGKEVGATGSLCDGIQWLYGYIEELEADRKKFGGNDSDHRKLRGEPIAWVKPDIVENQFINMRPRRVWWECNEGIGMAIYTAPQPVKPASSGRLRPNENPPPTYDPPPAPPPPPMPGNKFRNISQPAEPVKGPSDAEILEVWYALPGGTIEHEVIEFARALLARYGNTKQEK